MNDQLFNEKYLNSSSTENNLSKVKCSNSLNLFEIPWMFCMPWCLFLRKDTQLIIELHSVVWLSSVSISQLYENNVCVKRGTTQIFVVQFYLAYEIVTQLEFLQRVNKCKMSNSITLMLRLHKLLKKGKNKVNNSWKTVKKDRWAWVGNEKEWPHRSNSE